MHDTTSRYEPLLAAPHQVLSSSIGSRASRRTWLRPGPVHMQGGRLAQVAGQLPLPLHSPTVQCHIAKLTSASGGASPARHGRAGDCCSQWKD
jgi:hypothetical protein